MTKHIPLNPANLNSHAYNEISYKHCVSYIRPTRIKQEINYTRVWGRMPFTVRQLTRVGLIILNKNINATCTVLFPCVKCWNKISQEFSICTKSLFLSNVVSLLVNISSGIFYINMGPTLHVVLIFLSNVVSRGNTSQLNYTEGFSL